jgi:CheY-like chemotaxis protein
MQGFVAAAANTEAAEFMLIRLGWNQADGQGALEININCKLRCAAMGDDKLKSVFVKASGEDWYVAQKAAGQLGGCIYKIIEDTNVPEISYKLTLRADIAEEADNAKPGCISLCGKVLIIDDLKVNTMSLGLIVESTGAEAISFNDPEKALVWLETNKPELIICDVFMPRISGQELCVAAKKLYRNTKLPIAAYTAGALNADNMGSCFDYVLPKPASRHEIEKCLQRFLPAHGAESSTIERLSQLDPATKESLKSAIERISAWSPEYADIEKLSVLASEIKLMSAETNSKELSEIAEKLSQACSIFDISETNRLMHEINAHAYEK